MYKILGNSKLLLNVKAGSYINPSIDSEYLAWIDAGNTPLPADIPNPNDAINAQIAQIESSTAVPRIVREALLRSEERAAAQDATPANTAVMILSANYGYQKVLAVDNKVRALRAQLK